MDYQENEVSIDDAYSALKGDILAYREYNRLNYVLVPWFSSNEWKEVYQNLFSNSYLKWKAAYCQMNVWKARCPNLAVGIESTIPLLHAMIAQAEKSMDDSFKNSIVNLAIVRFVSIASKGFEKTFNSKKSLHAVASQMNIPGFLVGLRNGIIHNDNIAGSLHTLEAALESCFSWIKRYYWDKEFEFIKNKEKIMNDINSSERLNLKRKNAEDDVSPKSVEKKKTKKGAKDNLNNDSDSEESVKCYEDLGNDIQKFFVEILKRNFKKNVGRNKNLPLYNSTQKYLNNFPRESIQVIVDDLLCSKYVIESIANFNEVKCFKKMKVPSNLLTPIISFIGYLGKFNSINLLVLTLIRKSDEKELSLLCLTWVRIIVLVSDKKHGGHLLEGILYEDFHGMINWNEVVYELMFTSRRQHILLALEILKIVKVFNLKNENKMEFLKDASDSFLGKCKNDKSLYDVINLEVNNSEEILTIKDVILEARKSSKEMWRYVKELTSIATNETFNDLMKLDSSCRSKCTPLGVLSHQVGDPNFYKKLILDINDS